MVLAYDITNQQSFDALKDWVKEIWENGDENVIRFLVGNRADLEEERQVP